MDEDIKKRYLELSELDTEITDMTIVGTPRDADGVRRMILNYLRYHGWKVSGKTSLYMLTLLLFRQAVLSEKNMYAKIVTDSFREKVKDNGHFKDNTP